MNLTFPDKYFRVAEHFDKEFGDLETTTKLTDEKKLLFYALRQQVEKGPCTSPAPSFWYLRERYKHQAWMQLGNMTKFEAMVHFVKLVEEHLGSVGHLLAKPDRQESGASPVRTEEVRAAEIAGATRDSVDADIRARMEPTAENVAFLAREVMELRRELRHLRASASASASASAGAGASAPAPPPRARPVKGAAVHAPPTKPNVFSSGDMAPPVRPSSLRMAAAAMESNGAAKALGPRPPRGWAEWFGLI